MKQLTYCFGAAVLAMLTSVARAQNPVIQTMYTPDPAPDRKSVV